MNLKLIKSFMKDQCANTIIYFSGIFLITLFYSICTKEKIEFIYPFSIAVFLFLIGLVYHFVKYYQFDKALEEMIKYQDYHRGLQSCMNKKTGEGIKQLHMDYLDQLNQSETIRKKDRRFLSLWIHNMKTPIAVSDLLIQRMERGELTLPDGIEILKEENKKLLNSLDTVLNMIRLEDFEKDYIAEPIELLEELKIIINQNKSLFIQNHVYPAIETKLENAVILSDRKWNQLMINQIISNAVKYSKDENGASKTIHFEVGKEGQEVILSITDEGIGIPDYDLLKVCEPFFTGDNGRKGYHSSGIGLYFCSEVCKLLGHTLKINSEVGKGTTVKLSYLSKL